jgi:hypothetical protein
MGQLPTLDFEVRALASAIAMPEYPEGFEEARLALLKASNEHAVLEVAGIIAAHALISKTVDLAGFFSPIPTICRILARIIMMARFIRELVTFVPRMILAWCGAKEKQW